MKEVAITNIIYPIKLFKQIVYEETSKKLYKMAKKHVKKYIDNEQKDYYYNIIEKAYNVF